MSDDIINLSKRREAKRWEAEAETGAMSVWPDDEHPGLVAMQIHIGEDDEPRTMLLSADDAHEMAVYIARVAGEAEGMARGGDDDE